MFRPLAHGLFLMAISASFPPTFHTQEPCPGSEKTAGSSAEDHLATAHASDEEGREALSLINFALGENDRDGARELLQEVVAGLSAPVAGSEEDRLTTLLELARLSEDLGILQELLAVRTSLMELVAQLRPANHPDYLKAKSNMAAAKYSVGELSEAHTLFAQVHDDMARVLPSGHADLLRMKLNLAGVRYKLGDLEGAQSLAEEALGTWATKIPDHPDVIAMKLTLASAKFDLGDIAGAEALEQEALEALAQLLPPDSLDLLTAKANYALTRKMLGDIEGARILEESVLAIMARQLPRAHPSLLALKGNLAGTRCMQADFEGALSMYEEVLDSLQFPREHPDTIRAKCNTAYVKSTLGDLDGARRVYEDVLNVLATGLSKDNPQLNSAREGLAITMYMMGDLTEAHALFEKVLESETRQLSDCHPALLFAKQNLALTKKALGDLAGARTLEEDVLAGRERFLPFGNPDRLAAESNLAATMALCGEYSSARGIIMKLLAGVHFLARDLALEANRGAREGARFGLRMLSVALSLSRSIDPEHTLDPELFAASESLRFVSIGSLQAARVRVLPEGRRLGKIRTSLGDFITASGPLGSNSEEWIREVLRLAEERDLAERELRKEMSKMGMLVAEIHSEAISSKLTGRTAAASFLRYRMRVDRGMTAGGAMPNVDHVLAFVLGSDGSVRRVELGLASELEGLVVAWRRASGKPIAGRMTSPVEEERSEAEIGRALRARVLDPLFAAAGAEVRTLHVVLDDFLFLVPLDSLPFDDGARVGERWTIHVQPTLARLLGEKGPIPPEGTLVALGEIDFDAEIRGTAASSTAPANEENVPILAALATGTPPLERSGRPEQFEALRGTHHEIEGIVGQYEETCGGKPVKLSGSAATKAALVAVAPRARFLHVATHGWFASASFESQLDTVSEHETSDTFSHTWETLSGFAPETLCGLALAGANRGRDTLGRVPGILTAEELACFDLRNCELAVLSACETNVGIRRAGQGIQSLQTALHAAGVRTAITSLWKVDDTATQQLFGIFYTKLWKEGLGKAEALWQAKMALRDERRPLRDWAGWVLSGDPD